MNITIIKPAEETRSCGGAEMAVQWRVDGSSTGWIIQHVKFVKNRYNCSDKANCSSYSVKQMGQLFVLNRFLFAVPGELPLGSIPFFGG